MQKDIEYSFFKRNFFERKKYDSLRTSIGIAVIFFSLGLLYNFSDYTNTKEISHQITNFDGGEVEQFSVKALNDLMTLDSNFINQVTENTYKYLTLKGNHSYVETISRDYKPQLSFFKLDNKNHQTVDVIKSSIRFHSTPIDMNIQLKFKEKLNINSQEITNEKTACLKIIERKEQLKIDDIKIIDNDSSCK